MYIKFNFNKRPSKLCTGQDPEKIYRNQELNVKAYPSKYWNVQCPLIIHVIFQTFSEGSFLPSFETNWIRRHQK